MDINPSSVSPFWNNRHGRKVVGRLRAVAWAALLATLIAACAEPPATELPDPGPFVRVASTKSPAFSVRLPELLPIADVDLEIGEISDFALLGEPEELLLEGWSLESGLDATWGVGESSSLEITTIPARDLDLRLRCAPFHFAGSERQILTVVVNGQEVERIRMWRMMRTYRVRVPATALQTGANRLEFRYGYSAVPAEVLEESADDRDLAVMWKSIRIGESASANETVRASASGTRLDVPFGAQVNFFLAMPEDGMIRLGGIDAWGDGEAVATSAMRLRVEMAVDPGLEVRTIELAPEQMVAPIEIEPPVDEAGQLLRVSFSAVHLGDRRSRSGIGLSIDLPEVVSGAPGPAASESPVDAAATPPVSGPRPNILIYLIDTLRADHLGCYGYTLPTSPNIDRFADDSILFKRAVAQSSWTKPSVASLFTGLHPQSHGTNGRFDALPAEAVTLAERLADAGYETGAVFTNANLEKTGLNQGFESYRYLPEGEVDTGEPASARLHALATEWLDRRDPDKPFLLYLHTADPHAPYAPPEAFLVQVGQEVGNPAVGLVENVKEMKRHQVDESTLTDLLALYDAEIAHNDYQFGRLIRELENRGLYDSTLIVLLSDHGEEFFDHRWWEHGKTLYQEQLAVPLIVRFPGGVGAGTEVDRLAQHIDLYPTILEAAGLEPDDRLPGLSLSAGLDEGVAAPITAVSYVDVDGRRAESLMTEDMKLILHHYDYGPGRLVFDLSTDSGELENLWSQRPVLAGYLRSVLKAFELARGSSLEPEEAQFDDQQLEDLRALGYLN